MEPIFKSDVLAAYHDARGFVELVVQHGCELAMKDILPAEEVFLHCELPLRALIHRKHDYSTCASILIPPFPKLGKVEIGKVAYLVYSSRTAQIAKYVGDIVLADCPHEIFKDREAAIRWLLA